ncbi:MAG: hypothetical protein DRN12_01310 [Thermoplasmata archaeon]|nr:MAG: hypothetical protein DRN12_01310 [Thermoplasmata archaeon]
MNSWREDYLPILGMAGFFILMYTLALIILQPFHEIGGVKPAFENPEDPSNIVFILVTILVFTLIILLIAKLWKKEVIQFIILGAVGYTAFYAFFLPMFAILLSNPIVVYSVAIIITILLIVALYIYPEWYIVDISGIVVGTGAIIIFGMSLSVLLVVILLAILAAYDAISVYKTKHMIDLADTVMDLKLPVLLVIPKKQGYSLLKSKSLKEQMKENKKREAFFMGLGDVVMPGILVTAIYYNISNSLLLSIGTIIGILAGFIVLMIFVLKGKPQAGLPSLCGGAIIGYIISSLILYGQIIGLY